MPFLSKLRQDEGPVTGPPLGDGSSSVGRMVVGETDIEALPTSCSTSGARSPATNLWRRRPPSVRNPTGGKYKPSNNDGRPGALDKRGRL